MPAQLLRVATQTARGEALVSSLDAATGMHVGMILSTEGLRALRGTGDSVDLQPFPGTSQSKFTIRFADNNPADTYTIQIRGRSGGAFNATAQFTAQPWANIKDAEVLCIAGTIEPSEKWLGVAKRDALGVETLLNAPTSLAGATLDSVTGVKTVIAPVTADDWNGLATQALVAAMGGYEEHRRWVHTGSYPTMPTTAAQMFALRHHAAGRILYYDHEETSGATVNDQQGSHDITMGGALGDWLRLGQNDVPDLTVDSPPAPAEVTLLEGTKVVGADEAYVFHDASNFPISDRAEAQTTDPRDQNVWSDELRAVFWIDPVSANWWTTTNNNVSLIAQGSDTNYANLTVECLRDSGGSVLMGGFNKWVNVVVAPTKTAIVPGDGTGGTHRYVILSIRGDANGGVVGRYRGENDDEWTEIFNRTGGDATTQTSAEAIRARLVSRALAGTTAFTGAERTMAQRVNVLGVGSDAAGYTCIDRSSSADTAAAQMRFWTNAEDWLGDNDYALYSVAIAYTCIDRGFSADAAAATLVMASGAVDRGATVDAAGASLTMPVGALDRASTRDRAPLQPSVAYSAVDRSSSGGMASAQLRMAIAALDRASSHDLSPIVAALLGGFVLVDAILVNGVPIQDGLPAELLIGTDNYVELVNVREGVTATEITSAAATVILKDKNGDQVAGQTWPSPLSVKQGTTNTYWFSVGKAAGIEERRPYTAFLTFVATGGLQRYWELRFRGKVGQS